MSDAQSIVIDPTRWERIVELTGEAATECSRCGDCSGVCRWGLFDAGGPDMLALLGNAQLGRNADKLAGQLRRHRGMDSFHRDLNSRYSLDQPSRRSGTTWSTATPRSAGG